VADDADKPSKRSGQVRHDAGGRAIWEWAVESGRHAIDSTSRLLKRLDLSGLSLMDDSVKHWEKDNPDVAVASEASARKAGPQPPAAAADPLAQQGKSFNPYDTRAPRRGAAKSAAAPPRPRITQPPIRPKQPGLLARLFGRGKL
jgi:hypothetical protein